MLFKLTAFLLLVAILTAVVWRFPFLWELWLLGVIGAIWLLFFRQPDST